MTSAYIPTGNKFKSTRRVCEREILPLLIKLSRQGRAQDLRQLILKYNEEIKYFINKTDNSKLTALHYAARNQAIDCVRILIEEAGADVNVKTDEQTTPLHFAARYRRQSNTPTTEFIGATVIQRKQIAGKKLADSSSERVRIAKGSATSPTRQPLIDPERTERSNVNVLIHDEVIHYLVEHGAVLNGQDANGWTALHYAAIRGNQVATRQLLQEPDIDVEVEDHDGMRPIHLAASHNELEIVQCLLTSAVSLFAVTQRGCLPIHFACATGNVKMVKLFLKHCGSPEDRTAIVNAPNRDGETPLHWAVLNGHEEVVKLCLENNADPNLTPPTGETSLHMAARVGSVNTVRLLLQVVQNIDAADADLQTPLHKAADRNNVEVLKLLIEKGSDMESEDDNACTALLLAVSKGYVECVKMLIECGANLFAHDKSATSVVYMCAEANQLDVLKLILSYSAAKSLVNLPNFYGDTPLHVASKLGYLEIVKMLLDHGANQSAKNERERLAFHYAAKYGELEITQLFLQKSPGIISELDEDGNSAIHLAAKNGHQNIAELLLQYGAAVDSRNSMRWTPLDCAAVNGHRDCAQFLLENDSPVDPRDVSNTTPLHLACKHGHEELVELLLDWGADPGVRMVIDENLPDYGPNALDNAIDHGNKSCALILLKSASWKRALRNQLMGENNIITTPIRKLIINMPDLAEIALDRCVTANTVNDENKHEEVSEIYNFEFLEDTYAQWSIAAVDYSHFVRPSRNIMQNLMKCCSNNISETDTAQNGTELEAFQFDSTSQETDTDTKTNLIPYCADTNVLKNNHPLMLMIEYKRAFLLENKLVKMQLKRKWTSTGIVYYINLLTYVLFLALYSTYMLNAQSADLALRKNSSLSNYTVSQACSELLLDALNQNRLTILMVCKYAVLVFAAISLVKEFFQLIFTGCRYFTLENTVECSIFVLSILSVIDIDPCLSTIGLKQNWQWQCGAAGIFLAWLNLLLFVRRMSSLGLFVMMFTVIIGTFAKFFAVFFLFIVAFAFGFHILLSNHYQFNTLQNALLKTSVMSLGELEFDSLFNAQFSSNEYTDGIYFGGITYPLFVMFLIIMTLVIMNLLVGLAVDDIKGVMNQAVVKRLAMQIELLLDIDSLLPHWLRKRMETKKFSVPVNTETKGSTVSLSNSIGLRRNRLKDYLRLDKNDAEEEAIGIIRRQLSSMEERLHDANSTHKSILTTLNQVVTDLRGLRGDSLGQ